MQCRFHIRKAQSARLGRGQLARNSRWDPHPHKQKTEGKYRPTGTLAVEYFPTIIYHMLTYQSIT